MQNRMQIVIVDDEPLARSQLARLCGKYPDLDIVAQAESGAAAIQAIRAHRPDLVFLDIELQDMSGFDVLRSFGADEEPQAIMVTAYPEHALMAFENNAIDYLTKPVDIRRFGTAIERARRRCATVPASGVREGIVSELRASPVGAPPRQLVGEKANRLYFIDTTTIEYLESDGNYVTIHVDTDHYITRNTLKRLAGALAPLGFVRIERSILLNLRRIAFVERHGDGCYAFTLRGGRRLISSATYRKGILDEIRLGQLAGLRESE